MDDLSGQKIKGYELKERIGVGGFGAVYRAYQPSVGREVAVKIILSKHANNPDFIRRFEFEAQLIARLEHPYIVPLYDYWRDPDGAYLIMRWLQAGSLADTIKVKGAVKPNLLARYLDQIAAALTVAHRSRVVHRDIKPANILLDNEENAYLADFGIAKDLIDESEKTETGAVVGTFDYISPEQALSDSVSPQTDIYSLGVLLYEALTGQHPFPDSSPVERLAKHLNEPLPDLISIRSDLPEELSEVIDKATAKNPADRYSDVLQLAADFRAALGKDHATAERRSIEQVEAYITQPVNPYKGLRAFQEADVDDFFGRQALIERLLTRLSEEDALARFLAVVGPSGSGKSSVVRAGLIPALQNGALIGSEKWFVVSMMPGAHPLDELEIALLRVAINQPSGLMEQLQRDERGLVRAANLILPEEAELLLFIDQFEEVFTMTEDVQAARSFLALITATIKEPRGRVRVIITLRADFYDRPLMVPVFSDLMRERTEVVLPLSTEELEQSISGPANRVGLTIEPGLLSAMVADINEQPGALPLMQYALSELFKKREDQRLSLAAYKEIGGALGALAKRADELYLDLNEETQNLARQIFLRLVTLGEGTEDTRRRVFQSELLSLGDNSTVVLDLLDTFSAHRLLTTDSDPVSRDPTVELAHEAIIRDWGLLREWLEDSRADVRLQRILARAANDWLEAGQDASFLLRGTRLLQLNEWAAGTGMSLTQTESLFLERSKEEEEARLAQQEALERRSFNRLRALVGVFLVAALVAVGLTIFALNQSREANEQAEIARFNEAQAQSLALATSAQQALTTGDLDLALALAVEAVRIDQPPLQAVRTLSEVAFSSGARYISESGTDWISVLDSSPDGLSMVTASRDGTLTVWDSISGEILNQFGRDSDEVTSLEILPDGNRLAVGYITGSVIIWDLSTGEQLQTLVGLRTAVGRISAGPDGNTVIAWEGIFLLSRDEVFSDDLPDGYRLIAWDIESGEEIYRLASEEERITGFDFSPDRSLALISLTTLDEQFEPDRGIQLLVFDLETGAILAEPQVSNTGKPADLSVTINPAGDQAFGLLIEIDDLISGSTFTSTGLFISLPSGEVTRTVELDGNLSFPIIYSPDGSQIVVGRGSNFALLDGTTGEQIRVFGGLSGGHTAGIARNSVVFVSDGSSLISGGDDSNLLWWDIETGAIIQRLTGHQQAITGVRISPDGQGIISSSGDGSLRFWDLSGGAASQDLAAFRQFEGHQLRNISYVVVSPDGKHAVSTNTGNGPEDLGEAIFWDTTTLEIIHRLPGEFQAAAFLPDGKSVMLGGNLPEIEQSFVLHWDLESGEELGRSEDAIIGFLWHIDVSPDGNSVLFGGGGGDLLQYDIETLTEIRRFAHSESSDEAIFGVAFSPDNRTALSGASDGDIVLWNVDTGEEIRRYTHGGFVTNVAFSQEGARFLSTSTDQTIVLWDVESGEAIRTFTGHTNGVSSVAFTPDESQIISSAADGTLILWDVESGEALRTFSEHTNFVWKVALSPDGRLAYSSAQDGLVIIRPISALSIDDVLA
ncbi:MAG: protein kinase, partial [Chloroflexi bacterium]|nr:protein kinase [Chloroflexota bacterium]